MGALKNYFWKFLVNFLEGGFIDPLTLFTASFCQPIYAEEADAAHRLICKGNNENEPKKIESSMLCPKHR